MQLMGQQKWAAAVVAIGILVLAGCGNSGTSPKESSAKGRIAVVANFYPVQEAAERIGGKRVSVTNLTPVGGGPHDIELSPQALERLEGANVVLYIGRGFQPSVEKAAQAMPSSVETIDLLDSVVLLPVQPGLSGTTGEVDGEELEGGVDPHVWVDPIRFGEIADAIATALARADPDHADDYRANLAAYKVELDALDRDFASGLENCQSRTVVTSHRAFGYLAERYDLEQVAISGISPDEEPDPKSLEAVADEAKRKNVRVIFFESLVPKKLSETVANEIGASTDSLNPIEGLTGDELGEGLTYDKIQRRNLASLVQGLRCAKQ